MKKIIGALIALMLCLLVVGCSGNTSVTTTTMAGSSTTISSVTTTMSTATTRPLSTVPTSADVKVLGREGLDPETVTIRTGGSVTWIIGGTSPCKLVANDGSFTSERLTPGQKFSYTFEKAGTYEYTNVLFGAKGKVIVQ